MDVIGCAVVMSSRLKMANHPADTRGVRRVLSARWPWMLGIVIALAVGAPVLAASASSHHAGYKPPETPCFTVAGCRDAMTAIHQDGVILPSGPQVTFLRGEVFNPRVEKDGGLGWLAYSDSSVGRTFELIVSTSAPWTNQYGCRSLLGSVVRTPGGLSACLESPKPGEWTIIETVYERAGVFYQMHMDDHRVPSAAVSAEDRAWALDLIDSYR
jgi:hypothetical protein